MSTQSGRRKCSLLAFPTGIPLVHCRKRMQARQPSLSFAAPPRIGFPDARDRNHYQTRCERPHQQLLCPARPDVGLGGGRPRRNRGFGPPIPGVAPWLTHVRERTLAWFHPLKPSQPATAIRSSKPVGRRGSLRIGGRENLTGGMNALGLKREPIDVTPVLNEYLSTLPRDHGLAFRPASAVPWRRQNRIAVGTNANEARRRTTIAYSKHP
jgi:hypothetical protein